MLAGMGLGILWRACSARMETGGEQAVEGNGPPGVGLLGPRYPASGEGSLDGGAAYPASAGGLGCGLAGTLAGGLLGHLLGLLGALLGGHGLQAARSPLECYSGAPGSRFGVRRV